MVSAGATPAACSPAARTTCTSASSPAPAEGSSPAITSTASMARHATSFTTPPAAPSVSLSFSKRRRRHMDRNLALEFVRITEAAALASARWMGRGDANGADQAAVDAMRRAFDSVAIDGTVVIGEGERDEAPMLFIGEKVGRADPGSPRVDIAVDPLEGTNLCSTGANDSIAVIAAAQDGQFLNAPDTYMEKIAVGPAGRGIVDLRESPGWNLQ